MCKILLYFFELKKKHILENKKKYRCFPEALNYWWGAYFMYDLHYENFNKTYCIHEIL
jgi:hypothetical protein